jgi:monofunctional biosynthetic peptidoglycan transglycosylase
VGRFLLRSLLALGASAALFLAWLLFVWPPPSWWRTHWPAETAFMRMRSAQYADARDTTPRRYRPVPLDSISDWLEQAATAGEDDAFWQHHGIDWNAMRQALGYRRESFDWQRPRDRAELRTALGRAVERRDRLRGASTITQQLGKNLYLSPSRNPLRKVKEAFIAYRLEWALPKARILELYLNIAELGANTWGVEAASQRYFRRSAARLSIEQAALLIATLPHPRTSNPAHRPGRARWRQQLILRRLRGEDVELPEVLEEEAPPLPAPPPIDSIPADSLPVDSLPLIPVPPVLPDTVPPLPTDSAAAPPKDTTADSIPVRP